MSKLLEKNLDESCLPAGRQKTIKDKIKFSGVGIHSGKGTSIIISPAPENSGITFLYNNKKIVVDINKVSGDKLATSLEDISLIEHLLAAANGLGISNLKIECSSKEIPIMDGSSLPLVKAFEKAGISKQEAEAPSFILKEKIEIIEEGKSIIAEPADKLTIDFEVDYPFIGKQSFHFDGSAESFKKDIAPARTFGFEKDLDELHKNGFALGASLENALGISENGYMNTARFKNEPVRHKILDLIGDLALLGRPLNAKIKAYKSSHRLNHEFVRRILKNA